MPCACGFVLLPPPIVVVVVVVVVSIIILLSVNKFVSSLSTSGVFCLSVGVSFLSCVFCCFFCFFFLALGGLLKKFVCHLLFFCLSFVLFLVSFFFFFLFLCQNSVCAVDEYRESITTIVSVFSQRTKKESKKSLSQSDDSLK